MIIKKRLMIYLIGGPPRCGKTTLAKAASKKMGIPWISCDTLEVIGGAYMSRKEWNDSHPYAFLRKKHKTNDEFYDTYSSKKIVDVLRKEAEPVFAAIDMMTICEIKDGNDYIIEGYHILPRLAQKLIKKYGKKNIKAIFIVKRDAKKFAEDVHKSTTPNDWLILGTKKTGTFLKIGKMVALYSQRFEIEAKKFGFKVFSMDEKFEEQLLQAIRYLNK
ncbi:MAG: AAA family ATPase [Patescibacteria group bacterium]|nr:AAA family ATPase [Patescibacteria group bacterium]